MLVKEMYENDYELFYKYFRMIFEWFDNFFFFVGLMLIKKLLYCEFISVGECLFVIFCFLVIGDF